MSQLQLESLMNTYTGYVIAIIRLVGGNRLMDEDIEEIAADLWIKLWQMQDTLVIDPSKTKAYIGSMARHRTLNFLRQRGLQETLPLEENEIELSTPETILIATEEKHLISDAIDTLGDPDREIFIRRYFYFEKVIEIASALGLNSQTVGSKLCRGKEKLEKAFKERGLFR